MKESNIGQQQQKREASPEVKDMIAIPREVLDNMRELVEEMIKTGEKIKEFEKWPGKNFFVIKGEKDDSFIHLHRMEVEGNVFWLAQKKSKSMLK